MLELITIVLIQLSSLSFTAPESSATSAATPDTTSTTPPTTTTSTTIHGAGGWGENH